MMTEKRRVCLVLLNIRSTYNVGAILRTADGLGVEEVIYAGYTPRYDDSSLLPHLREKLNRQIEKAALGAERSVRQGAVETGGFTDLVEQRNYGALMGWLEERRSEGWRILGLENNLEATEVARRKVLGVDAIMGERIVLVLGEEVHGIPAEVRGGLTEFWEIPMQGEKESFNVSVATAIMVWEMLRPDLR